MIAVHSLLFHHWLNNSCRFRSCKSDSHDLWGLDWMDGGARVILGRGVRNITTGEGVCPLSPLPTTTLCPLPLEGSMSSDFAFGPVLGDSIFFRTVPWTQQKTNLLKNKLTLFSVGSNVNVVKLYRLNLCCCSIISYTPYFNLLFVFCP